MASRVTITYPTNSSIAKSSTSIWLRSWGSSATIPQYCILKALSCPGPSYTSNKTLSITLKATNVSTSTTYGTASITRTANQNIPITINLNYPMPNALSGSNIGFYYSFDRTTAASASIKPQLAYEPHEIVWTVNPSITSQIEDSITVSMTATDNYLTAGGSGNITYSIYIDDVLNTTVTGSSGSAATKTLTGMPDGTHTLKVVPSFGGLDGEAKTVSFTIDLHKTVKYYDGSQWIECIPYVYDNGAFVEVEPYYYDGSQWVLCSH